MNKELLTKELQNAYKQRELLVASVNQIDGVILYIDAKLKELEKNAQTNVKEESEKTS